MMRAGSKSKMPPGRPGGVGMGRMDRGYDGDIDLEQSMYKMTTTVKKLKTRYLSDKSW